MGSLAPSNGRGGSPVSVQEHGGSTGRSGASAQLSELPSPTRDLGFTDGDPRGFESPEAAPWTHVTCKTARTHRAQSRSGSIDPVTVLNVKSRDRSVSASTVTRATRDMSRDDQVALARR